MCAKHYSLLWYYTKLKYCRASFIMHCITLFRTQPGRDSLTSPPVLYSYTRMKWSLTGNRGELLRSSPKIHPTALMKQNNNTKVELFVFKETAVLHCQATKTLDMKLFINLKFPSIKSACCLKDLRMEFRTPVSYGMQA